MRAGDAFESTLGGQGSTRAARTARATYERHGDTPHDLTDRAAVGRLISRSPQLDDLTSTRGDDTRCGGAAVFNAMLLDGNPAANASALETTARARGLPLTETERGALASMREGHLTPHEAATLQHTVYRVADSADRRTSEGGLTGVELTATVGALRAAGGFPDTREANFRMERTGTDAFHWTTTTSTAHGTAHADSWPQANGYALIAGGPGATGFHHGGHFDDAFIADVTMTNDLAGTTMRTRSIHGMPGDEVTSIDSAQLTFSPSGVRTPPPERFDPDTGAPME